MFLNLEFSVRIVGEQRLQAVIHVTFDHSFKYFYYKFVAQHIESMGFSALLDERNTSKNSTLL
jgi:hypothetical protein